MKLLVITGDQGTGKSRLADFIKKVAPQVAVFDPLDDDNLSHFKHVRSMGVPCVVVEQRLAGHARATKV